MGKLDGKRLLMLGSNFGSVDMVKYARSQGAYVIVTDYLPDDRSAAKPFADETAMISTADIDGLYQFAKQEHIDGVFCGISEFNLKAVRKLASRLEKPCYFTDEQWRITQNKASFKQLCVRNGIPVPREFRWPDEEDQISYPVIVKPVDRSSCIGIRICHDSEELKNGVSFAMDKSESGHVVIEEYLQGREFIAVYCAKHGQIELTDFGELFTIQPMPNQAPVSMGAFYPSNYLQRYRNEMDKNVVAMFRGIDFKDGYFFVQGRIEHDSLCLFECGLRLAGGTIYRFHDSISGSCAIENLIDYALLGESYTGSETNGDPTYQGKRCCIFNVLNRGGRIAQIHGLDQLSGIRQIVHYEERYHAGDVVDASGTLLQVQIRFHIVCDSNKELADLIQHILNTVEVLDDHGENMIIDTIQPEQALEYW